MRWNSWDRFIPYIRYDGHIYAASYSCAWQANQRALRKPQRTQAAGPVDEYTGLAGHSAGAEFLARRLSENREIRADRVVWVAPYRDKAGKYDDFLRYMLDTGLTKRVGSLTIFNSTDVDPPIQAYANELVETLPAARLVEFEGYGHFRIGHNMLSPESPELLHELIELR